MGRVYGKTLSGLCCNSLMFRPKSQADWLFLNPLEFQTDQPGDASGACVAIAMSSASGLRCEPAIVVQSTQDSLTHEPRLPIFGWRSGLIQLSGDALNPLV